MFSRGENKKENGQLCRIEILTPSCVSEFNLGSHDGLKKARQFCDNS